MKNLLIFLSGTLVGAAGVLIYVKKKLIPSLRDELEKENREEATDYAEYWVEADEVESNPENISTSGKVQVKRNRNREAVSVDYTQYAKEFESKEAEKPEVKEPPSENTDFNGPYVIAPEEYDMYSDYHAHQYVVYADGVVIDDETEEQLEGDPELIFGHTAMEALKKERVVYVRDDVKKEDYSIELSDVAYDGPDYPDPEEDWRS